MSIFEKGPAGVPRDIQFASSVADTVLRNPELAKDIGFKDAGKSVALDLYYQVLTNAHVLSEDVDKQVGLAEKRLTEQPRKETVIFLKQYKEISDSSGNRT